MQNIQQLVIKYKNCRHAWTSIVAYILLIRLGSGSEYAPAPCISIMSQYACFLKGTDPLVQPKFFLVAYFLDYTLLTAPKMPRFIWVQLWWILSLRRDTGTGMPGYGYGSEVAVPGQYRTLFHGVSGMCGYAGAGILVRWVIIWPCWFTHDTYNLKLQDDDRSTSR